VLLFSFRHGVYFRNLGLEKTSGWEAQAITGHMYYMDKEVSPFVAAMLSSSPLEEFLLQHRRLGHMQFPILSQLYPDLYNKVKKEKLVYDACQFGKQTRSSYVPSNNRSTTPLEVIHSDVWVPVEFQP
jgi:hypothetical protein